MDRLREALKILNIDEWAVYGNPTEAIHLKKVNTLPTKKPDDGDYIYIKDSESATWTDITNAMTTYDNKEYQRKRASEYPSIAEQLDDLYHNGIDGWKSSIKAIKDKYPKG